MREFKLKRLNKGPFLAAASGIVLCQALAAPVAAQTGEGDTARASQAIDDIVVTAQKRSERLSDVPISITAIDEGEMARQGTRTIDDIGRVTPGLVMVPSGRGVGSIPLMRGISALAGAATVGVYIDDVPVQIRPSSFAGNPNPYLFDIDRVEVLRGPQGTLYGASSMGGTIRYVTKSPSYTETSGQFRGEVATVDDGHMNYEAAAALGGPLVQDKLAMRVSALYRRDGGFIERRDRVTNAIVDKNVDDAETIAVNTTIAWRATDNLEIKPALFFQQTERDDLPLYMPALPKFSQFNTSEQPSRDYFYVPSVTVNYDFGAATLTSVTSILRKSERQTTDYSTLQSNIIVGADFFPGFEYYPSTSVSTVTQHNITQELRLTSNTDGPFSWIVGGFFRRTNDHFTQFVRDEGLDPLLVYLTGFGVADVIGVPMLDDYGVYAGDTRSIEKQIAGFGEASYAITSALKATVGLRVSRSTFDFDRLTQGPLNGGVQHVIGSQGDTPVTPKFNLSYQFEGGGLVYATVERGFRAGGVNPPVPEVNCAADLAALGGTPPSDYSSDSLWSYEVGAKSQFFERKLSVNAAAYWIDWSNIQQPVSLPNCGFGYTDNLGSARSRGVEFEAQATPFDGLTLGARVGFVDAELTSDLLAPLNTSTNTQAVIAREGDSLIGIPKWTTSFSGEYVYPVSDSVDFYLRGDYQWLGANYRTQPMGRIGYNPLIFAADDYDRASMRGGLTTRDGWDISVFVDNLTNNDPVILATNALSPVSGTLRESTLRPRTIGLNVSKHF